MQLRKWAASGLLLWVAGGLVALLAILLIVLAAFPWGSFRAQVEQRLSKQLDRPVTIAGLERADSFSFTPTVVVRDVTIPQPAWSPGEPLARVATARIAFSVWPLLFGDFKPSAIAIDGMRLNLVRDAQGRENWRKDEPPRDRNGGGPTLRGLTVTNAVIAYRDAQQDRAFTVRLTADTATGLKFAGTGTVLGQPVTLTGQGPGIEAGAGKPWPFEALIDGPALRLAAKGTMDTPLDVRHMTLDLTARAQDLKLIDAIIEAGLIGTQPVRLAARARRNGKDWDVTGLTGTIGRSDIAGHVTVRKQDGRTRLDGAVTSNALLFDDFASDAGLAQAAAKEAAIGLRVVPDTRINLRKIDKTDGTIAFTIRRLIDGKRPSSLKAMRGRITLDNQLMTISDLNIALARGAITGSVRVDQRGGPAVPNVTLDLRLQNSSIAALAGGGDVSGRADGRARITGKGSTIREAVGNGNGMIGLVLRDGQLPTKIASALGFDVGGTLLAGKGERSGLRCVALRLDLRGGLGTVNPLIIDTTRSQSQGTGSIRFPQEAIAIRLTGAPKSGGLVRLPGAVIASGTLRAPQMTVPPETKSASNILKGIGRAISGKQAPRATDADCGALAARALG